MDIIKVFSKIYDESPGLVLNCVAIVIFCCIPSLVIINMSEREHKLTLDGLKSNLEKWFTYKLSGTTTNELAFEQINLRVNETILKKSDKPAKETQASRYEGYRYREDYGYNEDLRINIYKLILNTNNINKEKQINHLCSEVSSCLTKNNPFLANKRIIYIWMGIVVAYLVAVIFSRIVFFSRIGSSIEKEDAIDRKESLLNIVDIGFYLALIQFTGGMDTSCFFMLAMCLSICVAMIDFGRTWKKITGKFGNSMALAVKMNGFLVTFGTFTPIILYGTVFISGLFFATVNYENIATYWNWDVFPFFMFEILVLCIGIRIALRVVLPAASHLINKLFLY